MNQTYSHVTSLSQLAPMRSVGTKGVKVLFVDDEPQVLAGLRLQFGRRGRYEVLTAPSAVKGLEVLHQEQDVAVIVSDMRMPESDGVTFLRLARGIAPDATRMVLSGQADLALAMDAVNQGQIFAFLAKPCPPSALMTAVAAAAMQHRLVSAQRLLMEHMVVQAGMACGEPDAELLNLFGRAVRLFGCRYGALALLEEPGWPPRRLILDGLDAELFERCVDAGAPERLKALADGSSPLVMPLTAAGSEIEGLPPGHPRVTQFLGVSLASVSRRYGWMYFADRGPAALFGADDALAAATLGAAAAAICERIANDVVPVAA